MTKLGGAGGILGGGPTLSNAPDTLRSEDTIEFTLGLCEGPIAGLVSGPKSFFLSDTPLVSQNGRNNFRSFELHSYHGDANASIIKNALGGTSSTTTVGVPLAEATPVIRSTPPTLVNTIDRLEVRINFSQLFKLDNNGSQMETTAQFKIQYRQSGTTTWLNFFANPVISLKGKTTGTYIKEFVKRVPRINGNWEIQVTKVSVDTDFRLHVVMAWESFQSVTTTNVSHNSLALVRGLGVASNQFTSIPALSGVYAGKLIKVPSNYNPVTRVYTGIWDGTFKLAFSDNPAWCLYDLFTNSVYGVVSYYPQLLVDRFSFYDASQWCDTLVPRPGGGFQPRYTYNDLIQRSRRGLETLIYVAASFGAIVTEDLNGSVVLKVDKPSIPVQLFGVESITVEEFHYQKSDITTRVNDIEVSFTNPNLGWASDVRRVKDQALIDKRGRIPLALTCVGCTDVYEAQRRAKLRLISANTEVTTVTFSTARQGLLIEPYDVIGIVDSDKKWGTSGRIKSASGLTINLRDPLYLVQNTDLSMDVQSPSGIHNLTVQNQTGSPYTTALVVVNGSLPADLPSQAQFALSSLASLGLVKPFRVLTITDVDGKEDQFNITAIEINVNKYGDADNMTSSGEVAYSFDAKGLPTAPVNLVAKSGTEELYIASSGQVSSRIYLTWDQDPRSFVEEFQVFYRRLGIDVFQRMTITGHDCYISNVQDGMPYEIYVQAVNRLRHKSHESAHLTHTVIGKTQKPSDVSNVTASLIGNDVHLNITPISDLDLAHYEISLSGTVIGTTPNTVFIHKGAEGQQLVYSIVAVDTSGNKSLTPFQVSLTMPTPSSPMVTTAYGRGQYIIDISKPLVLVKEYVITLSGNEVFRGSATHFQAPTSWVGTKTLSVVATNPAGLSSPAYTTNLTVVAPPVVPLVGGISEVQYWLSWEAIRGTLETDHYVVRNVTDNVVIDNNLRATTFSEGVTWLGQKTFEVYAVDVAGNLGAAGSLVIQVDPPAAQNLVGAVSGGQVTFTWKGVMGSLPIRNYHFYDGAVLLATLNAQSFTKAITWGGLKTFSVYAEDVNGNLSSALSFPLTISSPSAPAVTAAVSNRDIVLHWTNPVSELKITSYEIYKNGSLLQTTASSSLTTPVDFLGTAIFEVKAVDTAGNIGVGGSASISVSPPSLLTVNHSFVGSRAVFNWTKPLSDLPIVEYIIKRGTPAVEVARVSSPSYSLRADWGGFENFEFVAVDSANHTSVAASISLEVVLPNTPVVRPEVLDNNVLLRWTNYQGSLPISSTEIRKGTSFDTAQVLQTVDATFASFFEFQAGTYSYWLVNIDTAGNYGTPLKSTVSVTQPPDFILQNNLNSTFSGLITQGFLDHGLVYLGLNPSETYQGHFTSRGYTSPQAQVNAGFPMFLQPTDTSTPSSYVEDIDYGVLISSSIISVTPTVEVLAGNGSISIDVWHRALPTDPWVKAVGVTQSYAQNFRYVQVHLNLVADTPDDLVRISALNIRLSTKIRSDSGSGTANAGDVNGTTVNFNLSYVDITSITVTPNSTTPVIAIYDFIDTSNPVSFQVYLYDKNGVRVTGSFSWSSRGF